MCQTLPGLAKAIKKECPDGLVTMGDLGISIAPGLITVDPEFNTRHEGYESFEEYFAVPAHRSYLERMKEAYKKGEQLPPPIVVQVIDNQLILRDGHCRLFAINELISEGVNIQQIRVDEWRGDEAQRDQFILKTREGIPLSPFAIGAVFNRMKNHGWSVDQIARDNGITSQHTQNYLDLYNLAKPLKTFVLKNLVSASMMLQLVRTSGLSTAKLVLLIEQQLKTKSKNLVAKLQEKRDKVAKKKGDDAAKDLEIDDESLFAEVIAESEEEFQAYNSASGRSFLKPSDLKPKKLPKKLVEDLNNTILDMDAIDDDTRITREMGTDLVLMKLSSAELDSLRQLRKQLNDIQEENLRRLGVVTEDDDTDSVESANDGQTQIEAAGGQAA